MDKSVLYEHGLKTKLFSAQSSKALFIDECLKRVKIGDKDIDSHVKFVSIEKQRVINVLLNDYIVCVVEFCEVVDHFDAPSSRFTDWLHYPVV